MLATVAWSRSGGGGSGLDALDVETVRSMVAQAKDAIRPKVPSVVLAQLDINPATGAQTFRLADAAGFVGVDVTAPSPDTPVGDWGVLVTDKTPLLGHPNNDLDLQAVKVTPAEAGEAVVDHWPGCALRSITLAGDGDVLIWYVFCDLPEGTVSGVVNARTGAFTPSDAPPSRPPPTATP
jgi:hypothetical protein